MDGPAMSVIVVTEGMSECLRWTVECLKSQSAAAELECILVTRSRTSLASFEQSPGSLHALRIVEWQTAGSAGAAKAVGVLASTAPVVAFAEDHSYPDRHWAEALLGAHREGRYAAVGPVVSNANPISAVSVACFLVYYGMYMTAGQAGEAQHLPGNHSSYRREILTEYGARLPQMLESEIVLHRDLLGKGMRLHQEPAAQVYHLNYSTIGPAVREYYLASRVLAAERCRSWSSMRRRLYAGGSPLLPALRLLRIFGQARAARLGWTTMAAAIAPSLVILGAGAAGEMLGYGLGQGSATRGLARFEREHASLYTARDLEESVLFRAKNHGSA